MSRLKIFKKQYIAKMSYLTFFYIWNCILINFINKLLHHKIWSFLQMFVCINTGSTKYLYFSHTVFPKNELSISSLTEGLKANWNKNRNSVAEITCMYIFKTWFQNILNFPAPNRITLSSNDCKGRLVYGKSFYSHM